MGVGEIVMNSHPKIPHKQADFQVLTGENEVEHLHEFERKIS